MKELLLVITSDPRASGAPAEAVRIAAGVGAWQKVIPSLYLHGAAVLCLDEFAEDFPEGLLFTEYLPSIPRHGGVIYTEAGSPFLREITTSLSFQETTPDELPRLIRRFPAALRV